MKELEDYNWFPKVLRNFQTEFIGFVVSRFKVYNAFVEHLKSLSLTEKTMTDLCSGSGEPAISIFIKSNCFNQLVLTDKYPNVLRFENDKIVYMQEPMDVMKMEFNSGTCYTMFNAFHHFKDEDKLRISDKIMSSGSSAFFVEILEPSIDCLLKVCISTTIGTILFTPFIKPFSVMRLVFTYLLPVNILTITFDGIVSVLKSGSVAHYKKLFSDHDAIKVVRLTEGFTPLVVIQIIPNK